MKAWKAIFGGKATFMYILELQLGSASIRLLAKHRGKEVGVTDMPYEPTVEERPQTEDAMSDLPRKYFRPLPSDKAAKLTTWKSANLNRFLGCNL